MTTYKISKNFTLQGDNGGNNDYMLFDTENGSIYKLNEISFKILSLFDGNRTDKEIKKIISSEYNTETEIINKDFDELTKKLLDKGIIYKF